MTVRSHGSGEDRRIGVLGFGRGENLLTVAEATELRDELSRELGGAPQALTDREAMVWAAAFVERLHGKDSLLSATKRACDAVETLRSHGRMAADDGLSADQRAMLLAMTGGGR